MRKMTLNDIKDIKRIGETSVNHSIDHSVNLFRVRTLESKGTERSTPPRDPDEVKALNYLARNKLLSAMSNGTVQYDKERRVLSIAKYSRSE
ncbi:hypothetical protein [Cohnella silvisoli]|uniref:Uncharacterized protein n=1 Tax=Cohnella silvisoli TaxID=2873699 RepID=A0ABV1L400_9BACL|nr:hypothetical protein [Cohnella silvisoli]MCD9026298.1 hypothetical protein [Cohnella silvisoli]